MGARYHLSTETVGPPGLFGLLIPEDRQCDQGNRDDPEDDIFSAIFLFGFSHKRNTAYMKSGFKCCSEFPEHDCECLTWLRLSRAAFTKMADSQLLMPRELKIFAWTPRT